MASWLWMPHMQFASPQIESKLSGNHVRGNSLQSSVRFRRVNRFKVLCQNSNSEETSNESGRTGIQLYREIER